MEKLNLFNKKEVESCIKKDTNLVYTYGSGEEFTEEQVGQIVECINYQTDHMDNIRVCCTIGFIVFFVIILVWLVSL